MPKLSIIMPVYNTEKYLPRSIQSIINQTFKDWELILVNDGSKDNSLEVCKEYEKKDTRIKVIDKENGGAGSARNAGLEAAKGEYIAFPDSDDWLENTTYEICINELCKSNVDLLLFGEITTVYNDKNDTIEKEIKDFIEAHECKNKEDCRKLWCDIILKYHMNAPWNKIYKKSIIEQNNIRFPNLRRMQDGVFNLNYFDCISSFKSIEEYLYHFIWHSSDFQMKKMKKDFIDCAITYHDTAITMLERWGIDNPDCKDRLDDWFSETITMAEFLFSSQNSFGTLHKHVKEINENLYINEFYKKLFAKRKLAKKEYFIMKKYNCLITAYILIKRKMERKNG